MTAPIRSHVRKSLETMGYAMIDFLLVRISFSVRLANTLCDNFRVTVLVARVFAISALHPRRIFEEVATESTPHDVVKLLLNELVAILFVNFFLALTNSSLALDT